MPLDVVLGDIGTPGSSVRLWLFDIFPSGPFLEFRTVDLLAA